MSNIILPSVNIHVTGKLIDRKTGILINDKIKLAKRRNLNKANFDDFVGYMTGFDLIKTDRNCGGYCDYLNKEIALNMDDKGGTVVSKITGFEMSYYDYKKLTLCHEIGHAIQAETDVFEKSKGVLSWYVDIEHKAESIAYKLYNGIFDKISYKWFSSYFNNDGIEFLKEYYGNWVEDDNVRYKK